MVPPSGSAPEELGAVLTELNRSLLGKETLEETLDRVARLAVRAIPDCDMGSVTLIRDGKPITAASTQELVDVLDAAQYESRMGPCLTAIAGGSPIVVADMAADDRWPSFRDAATANGVGGVLSLPLVVGEETLGGLNLYSMTQDAIGSQDRELGEMYASQAAVAVANALVYHAAESLAAQLAEALESRAVIDQAKGILMERESVGPDEAFEILRRASQRSNRKVRDIAREIVDSAGSA